MKNTICLSLLLGSLLLSGPAGAAPAAGPAAAAEVSVSPDPIAISASEDGISLHKENFTPVEDKPSLQIGRIAVPAGPELLLPEEEKPAEEDAESPEEEVPVPPTEETAVWQEVTGNSRYSVAYDTGSIRYDDRAGILTLWNRWRDKRNGRTTLLFSQYDVRLRVCADLYQYIYDGAGNLVASGRTRDDAWYPLSPDTLGMALCNALKGYLISQ